LPKNIQKCVCLFSSILKIILGNRKRFRIDEDYLIYGPGGEGLKRSPINPTVMQYEFDDTLRTAIKALTYKGKSAAKNYEDGMGQERLRIFDLIFFKFCGKLFVQICTKIFVIQPKCVV
jgi:hypothetical protein